MSGNDSEVVSITSNSVMGPQAIVTETDIEQLGGNSPAGTTIGKSTSLISVYDVAPTAQAAAITVPTDLATSITAITAIIADLKAFGITL